MVYNRDRSFYRFVTIHACDGRTDGRTDGQTEFSSLDRVCIPCSAVNTNKPSISVANTAEHCRVLRHACNQDFVMHMDQV